MPGRVVFTIDGTEKGPPIPVPERANDMHVHWRGTASLTIVVFARDGLVIGVPEIAPTTANDFEFSWLPSDVIERASWTVDGGWLADIPVPRDANDLHFWLLPAGGPARISRASWTFRGDQVGE